MKVEVLHFDGCPGHQELMPRLRGLLAEAGVEAEIEQRRIETIEAAQAAGFLGSPSVRIDGQDVDPGASSRRDYGLECRVYRAGAETRRTPPDEWIIAAARRSRERGADSTDALTVSEGPEGASGSGPVG